MISWVCGKAVNHGEENMVEQAVHLMMAKKQREEKRGWIPSSPFELRPPK
jgi:hypothetical protein